MKTILNIIKKLDAPILWIFAWIIFAACSPSGQGSTGTAIAAIISLALLIIALIARRDK